jgi:hypothetical protein
VSDATPRIAGEQFRAFEELEELPADSVLTLDTRQAMDAQVAEVAGAFDHLSRHSGRCADRCGP